MCKDISIEYWSKRKKKRLNYFDIKTKQMHKKNISSAAENGLLYYEMFIICSNQIKYN